MMYSIFVSCPKGLEYLLDEELASLGFNRTRISPQGVYGEASLTMIYRICLWSRLAARVHLILFSGRARNQQELHALCRSFQWDEFFSAHHTLAVSFHGESDAFRHTLFGAQVIKDAIVDFFREKHGVRPAVDRHTPDALVHAHLKHDTVTVSLDLTGYSLHQRGYRLKAGLAPIKENVAAALLIRAQWPMLHRDGAMLHDPFCGAGTLVIEAAMMAANIAPGLLRDDQAFQCWNIHDDVLWAGLKKEAHTMVKPLDRMLRGTDSDVSMLAIARENAKRAGVSAWITWDMVPFSSVTPPNDKGLVVTNPPYGVRLGEENDLVPLYQEIGRVLHTHYQGWQVALLTPSLLLAKATGLRSHKQYTLYNGAIACKVYCFVMDESNQRATLSTPSLSPAASMFANRLKKNYLHLQKWAKRHQISCYRVYDADLPEYAYAIDIYNDYAVLQEYAAPSSIDPKKAEQRSLDVIKAVPFVLNIPSNHLIIKERKQQKGTQQYQKLDHVKNTMVVSEGCAKFHVNLTDYLDTGLFLDHRLLRLQFALLKKGTRFLNCFCYTATASVHAALAGATTVNVDLSNTYLTWAKDNFKLNQLDVSRHQFIQDDCLEWLTKTQERFDVIFLDPPSFSNSKRMQTTLDIQRDHDMLIECAKKLLNPGGVLYFSTNLRNFKLSSSWTARDDVKNITSDTLDLDFKRNAKIHQCFKIHAT